jgi:hypothetical protein
MYRDFLALTHQRLRRNGQLTFFPFKTGLQALVGALAIGRQADPLSPEKVRTRMEAVRPRRSSLYLSTTGNLFDSAGVVMGRPPCHAKHSPWPRYPRNFAPPLCSGSTWRATWPASTAWTWSVICSGAWSSSGGGVVSVQPAEPDRTSTRTRGGRSPLSLTSRHRRDDAVIAEAPSALLHALPRTVREGVPTWDTSVRAHCPSFRCVFGCAMPTRAPPLGC